MDKKRTQTLEVPFKPGDDLYYIVTGDRTDDGPGLFEIKCQKNGVRAIQVDIDGKASIVDEGSDAPEPPGGQWSCLSPSDAMDWAMENMPGSVHLCNKPVTAIYGGPTGERKAITFGSTLQELEELVCTKPCTMSPDGQGILAIYNRNATRNDAIAATFLNDSAGRPVDVIYGAYVLIAVEKRDGECFYRPVDMPPSMLDAINGKISRDGAPPAYDPTYWTMGCRMTVAMLREYLSRIPGDATIHCCGSDPVYLHYSPDTNALSFDCEDLADLPEYEGREPAVLTGRGE